MTREGGDPAGIIPSSTRRLERALREGSAPPVLPEDAVRSLDVIEAAQKSSAERRAIPLKV